MQKPNPWKLTSTKTVYENSWIKVREDAVIRPEGSAGIYSVMESKNSVIIVVFNHEQKVYLNYAFNYPFSKWTWGLPGGSSDGESVIDASKRELLEETGILAESWTKLGTTRVCNGLMTEQMTSYLAEDLEYGDRIVADDTEIIDQGKFFTLNEVNELIINGELDDGQSITALYLAGMHTG